MSAPAVSEAEFVEIWRKSGSPTEVAKVTGTTIRAVMARRKNIEKKGIELSTTSDRAQVAVKIKSFAQRRSIGVHSGVVIVFSDAHYWPGHPSIAHYALLETCRVIKPKVVIANGDLLDGVTISRHEPPRLAQGAGCKG